MNVELETYVNRLVEAISPWTIILHGSRARGDFKPSSDFDITVIDENFPQFMQRWDQLRKYRAKIPLWPRGFTPEEFLATIKSCNPTALDAVHEGKILLDRGLIQTARTLFKEILDRYELKKKENGQISLNPPGNSRVHLRPTRAPC